MDARWRNDFYFCPSTPFFICDGDKRPNAYYTTYAWYVTERMPVESPLFIDLARSYDQSTRTGTVFIRVTNVGDSTYGDRLYWVLDESGMAYGERPCNHVVRDVLPDTQGLAMSITPGQTLDFEGTYEVDTALVADSCRLVVFVQSSEFLGPTGYEIWQGAWIPAVNYEVLTCSRSAITDTTGRRHLFPGGESSVFVTLVNSGTEPARGVTGVLRTTEPGVTILDSLATWPDITAGSQAGNEADPLRVRTAETVPDGHPVEFTVVLSTEDRYRTTVSFADTASTLPPGIAEPGSPVPPGPSLALAGPNPARRPVAIDCGLSHPASMTLAVYDAAGKLVRMLERGPRDGGRQRLTWDLVDRAGRRVSPGVYLCVLESEGTRLSRKLAVVR